MPNDVMATCDTAGTGLLPREREQRPVLGALGGSFHFPIFRNGDGFARAAISSNQYWAGRG
jgi:hypothetical protein